MTDLNYLLARHQRSIFASRNATNVNARAAHLAFAGAYVERINAVRGALGMTAPLVAPA